MNLFSKLLICIGLIGSAISYGCMQTKADFNSEIDLSEATPGEAVQGFLLQVKSRNNAVQSGQPVILNITLRNTTKRDIIFNERVNPQTDYAIRVKGKWHGQPPVTRYAQKYWLLPMRISSIDNSSYLGPFTLKAGESRTYTCQLHLLYDMTLPDVYTIEVVRKQEILQKLDSEGNNFEKQIILAAKPITVEVLDNFFIDRTKGWS